MHLFVMAAEVTRICAGRSPLLIEADHTARTNASVSRGLSLFRYEASLVRAAGREILSANFLRRCGSSRPTNLCINTAIICKPSLPLDCTTGQQLDGQLRGGIGAVTAESLRGSARARHVLTGAVNSPVPALCIASYPLQVWSHHAQSDCARESVTERHQNYILQLLSKQAIKRERSRYVEAPHDVKASDSAAMAQTEQERAMRRNGWGETHTPSERERLLPRLPPRDATATQSDRVVRTHQWCGYNHQPR